MLREQIDAVIEDIGVDAVKIGMLHAPDIVQVVADAIDRHQLGQVVLDPVMIATSGAVLIENEAVQALVQQLFHRVQLITPNLDEAGFLVGRTLKNEDDMEAAADQLLGLGALAVLIKGGHLSGDTVADLFVSRNVGNVVPAYGQMMGGVSTAIEYAVMALGVQHIIICGHSDCGAMRAVLNPDSLEKMPTVKAWLRHAEVAKTMVHENCNCADEKESMPILTEENVIAQLQHLRTHPSVASRMANGHLFIHGWVYDIETSKIEAYDAASDSFLPLAAGEPVPCATPRGRY